MTIKKLMSANRGEIAIRTFRACTEMGIRTVAIYSEADRYSLHRYKADEAYLIGIGSDPVDAYMNAEQIVELAKKKNVDAIHPGYGFLSESNSLAELCKDNGIIFVGPNSETLTMFGNKQISKNLAKECGIPIINGSDIIDSLAEAEAASERIGYPVMIKAIAGGGGRGIRVARTKKDLMDNYHTAKSEAKKAFGSDEIIIEKYVADPKHIEVQLLADKFGNIVHLYERDCSVQRRHQKLIEMAPSVNIKDDLLGKLYHAAVTIGKTSKLVSAATVEFLVDKENNFYFLEVNPRIQVEHTVTELITGIDIVQSQIFVSDGFPLNSDEIGIFSQESIKKNGYAIQCRVTTEDPENNFMPDTGIIRAYRSPAGFGVRLDAGNSTVNAKITPFYDSLLVKLSTWATSLQRSVKKMDRALKEFRIRGVKTNILFLENVVNHPSFLGGNFTTNFVDNTPSLFIFRRIKDRATKAMWFLSNNIVNNPSGITISETMQFPNIDVSSIYDGERPEGTRNMLDSSVEAIVNYVKDSRQVLFTDTTFRDAHQSLLATRMRTIDLANIAESYSYNLSDLFSIEMWGGATFDVAYRFLKESPWDRLRILREKIPNILFQMLLRASNAVGYKNYPDNVVRKFIKLSSDNGIDLFRIFDCFNWIEQLKPIINEVKEEGKIVEAAICYSGDILDKSRTKYTLDYYLDLAGKLKESGTDIIGIKDMAGLIKPYAAKLLVSSIKKETNLPVHFHTHDTSGTGLASTLMAIEGGADIVDAAVSSMSDLTSQPNMNSIIAALKSTQYASRLNEKALQEVSNYFETVRKQYFPFESGLKSTTAEVYDHEIPGGQYSNLVFQVEALGLYEQWRKIKKMYKNVSMALGDIIKVTPSSKVVSDLALFLVKNDLSIEDIYTKGKNLSFPQSVVDFFKGMLGQPYGGFPERLRQIVLKGESYICAKPGKLLGDYNFESIKLDLRTRFDRNISDEDIISYALYPKVFEDYLRFTDEFGDPSNFDTRSFFYPMKLEEEIEIDIEEGKTLIIKYLGISKTDDKGYKKVYFELNGQPRTVMIKDKKVAIGIKTNLKGDISNPKDICAAMPGKIIDLSVKEGDIVKRGDILATTEAMKIETKIKSGIASNVAKIYLHKGDEIESGDIIMRLG